MVHIKKEKNTSLKKRDFGMKKLILVVCIYLHSYAGEFIGHHSNPIHKQEKEITEAQKSMYQTYNPTQRAITPKKALKSEPVAVGDKTGLSHIAISEEKENKGEVTKREPQTEESREAQKYSRKASDEYPEPVPREKRIN